VRGEGGPEFGRRVGAIETFPSIPRLKACADPRLLRTSRLDVAGASATPAGPAEGRLGPRAASRGPGLSRGGWQPVALGLVAVLVLTSACGTRVMETFNRAREQVIPLTAPSPEPRPCAPASPPPFSPPSYKGINYGSPDITVRGDYVGLEWLRSGTGKDDFWTPSRVQFQSDLDYFQQQHLGKVIRLFFGLDQAMKFDPKTGFRAFYPQVLDNFDRALAMVSAHGMKAIVVVYDEEDPRTNLGEFHFEALDGKHADMRAGYLRALSLFMQRFGENPAVLGWDLFNEAYNVLTNAGGLPPPRYDWGTVHQWLRDLYRAAKCAAPKAWLTVSDATELYHKDPPDAEAYNGAVDFYDVHVYSDNANLRDYRYLHMPIIVGEAGAQLDSKFIPDRTKDASALQTLLQRGRGAGVSLVLAHAQDHLLFSAPPRRLTDAGEVLARYPG
jgi:hypothetical protein